MKMTILFTLTSVAFLSSCTVTPSVKAKTIKEADSKMVSKCQFLGTVFGNSMLVSMVLVNKSGNNAVVAAKEKAVKLGANHIVIESMKAADLNGGSHVIAKAYKCK